ncbi:exonuclease domain-containing protein, partial [Chloroflexota bacterium]
MNHLSTRTYISLDLETTGLNPDSDEITEIACIKFQGDEVLDTFHSLVNPQRALPYRIQLLCGISQSEVDTAPPFSALAPSLISFLQGCSIIGHNIFFDLRFLAHKGIEPTEAVYDTYELATLLLFQLPDYSLNSIARHLELPTPTHRAMADATATRYLFYTLLERACRLNLSTIEEINRLAERMNGGLADFLKEAVILKAEGAFSISRSVTGKGYENKVLSWDDSEHALTPSPRKILLDANKLSAILETDGLLAQALPGYERRQEQLTMMQAVAQAFNSDEHLMVEAGTGTGKSIAYLLPSLLFSSQNGLPVVISTNTINLQEQLINKDIPDLLRTLELGDQIKAVQVKGRTNYLCLRRLTALEASDSLSPEEARLIARIKIWLESTQTGDRAELNLNNNEISTWNKLCAQVGDRLEAECPYHQKGRCFLQRARRAATNAHIIVVNHALLLSDMINEAKILPEYGYLIIDEAHHLEEEATSQLGSQVTQWDLFDYL